MNSALAASLLLENVRPFDCELGLIGEAHLDMTVNEYADFVCRSLGADSVRYIPSDKHVKKVAVIGAAQARIISLMRLSRAPMYL